MSTISRRAFLKTVGVGALSVAAVSVLAGCDKLPVNPETPVSVATIEGKVATEYKVADLVTVSVAKPTFDADEWANAYTGVFKSNSVKSVAAYEAKTAAQQADLKKKAEEAAKLANVDEVEVNVTVTMLDDEAKMILADSGNANGFKSSAFTASSNGAALDCTINNAYVDATQNTVECTVKIAGNVESFDLVVALPGANKAVKYTFKNDGYLKTTDPTSEEFYKYSYFTE